MHEDFVETNFDSKSRELIYKIDINKMVEYLNDIKLGEDEVEVDKIRVIDAIQAIFDEIVESNPNIRIRFRGIDENGNHVSDAKTRKIELAVNLSLKKADKDIISWHQQRRKSDPDSTEFEYPKYLPGEK